jgi:hypothetical protein
MLFVLERRLNVSLGHFAPQLKLILKSDQLKGKATLIAPIGSDTTQFAADTRSIRLLLQPLEDDNSIKLERDAASLSRELLSCNNKAGRVMCFIPTARKYEIQLALNVLKKIQENICFCIRLLNTQPLLDLNKDEIEALRNLISSKKIIVASETDEMAADFMNIFRVQVGAILTLPSTVCKPPLENYKKYNKLKSTVGFPGELRAEKGLSDIPAIISKITSLQSKKTECRDIEFWMQRPLKNSLREYFFWLKIYLMTRFTKIKINILHPKISDSELIKMLSETELCILPYQIQKYKSRGSGFLLDSLVLGIPVVFRKGMGLEKYSKFGSAHACKKNSEIAIHAVNLISKPPTKKSLQAAQQALLRDFREAFSFLQEYTD